MIQLGLQNFQSIEKAKFEFPPGFTAIVGPTASGKSALFRAMKAVICNPSRSKHYIKYGEKGVQVAIKIDTEDVVTWLRTETTSAYKVGTQMYSKAGRIKLHGIRPKFPLLVDEAGKLLNFHTEWDVLFPFDKSPADLFKMFEDIFQISNSKQILELMKDDDSKCKGKIAEYKAQKEKNLSKIEGIGDFLSAVDQKKLEGYQSAWEKASKDLPGMEQDVTTAEKISKDLENSVGLVKKEFKIQGYEEWKRLKEDLSRAMQLAEQVKGVIPEKKEFDRKKIQEWEGIEMDLEQAVGLYGDIATYGKVLDERKGERECVAKDIKEVKACPLCKRPF